MAWSITSFRTGTGTRAGLGLQGRREFIIEAPRSGCSFFFFFFLEMTG
jgi:hypothetical protein